jgi:hypothetical protein
MTSQSAKLPVTEASSIKKYLRARPVSDEVATVLVVPVGVCVAGRSVALLLLPSLLLLHLVLRLVVGRLVGRLVHGRLGFARRLGAHGGRTLLVLLRRRISGSCPRSRRILLAALLVSHVALAVQLRFRELRGAGHRRRRLGVGRMLPSGRRRCAGGAIVCFPRRRGALLALLLRSHLPPSRCSGGVRAFPSERPRRFGVVSGQVVRRARAVGFNW